MTFDLADEKVKNVYRKLEAQYCEMLRIYDSGSRKDLKDFFAKYLQPSEFTRYMFGKIEGEFGDKVEGAMTIEEVCRVEED